MTVRRYISPPAAGALLGYSRIAAYHRFAAGRFGPLIRQRGVTYADLAEVERAAGHTFTDEQIERAIAGYPDRLLILETQEVA